MRIRTICAIKLGVLAVCLCLLALQEEALTGPGFSAGGNNPNVPGQQCTEKSQIEVVFVLDTTGSMGGLIRAAKEKIWSIVNTLASAESQPLIKIGLIGYRDRGDEYVTKLTDLTDDLDSVYSDLMAYRADGGGDGPESVNQALHEAVSDISWSRNDETYRVIFLVGDYPPHMDYSNDVPYYDTCSIAVQSGIVINTIQCGTYHETVGFWRDIAKRAHGRYFSVEQSGSAILVSTPFDKKLAEAAKELDATRIYYGSEEELKKEEMRQDKAKEIYENASTSANAARAAFNSSKAGIRNLLGDTKELVDDLENRRVDISKLKEEKLPQKMQAMTVSEREKYVADNLARRQQVQQKIDSLARQRQAFIEEKIKKSGSGDKSLDSELYDCIKKQGGKKGFTYKKGPSY